MPPEEAPRQETRATSFGQRDISALDALIFRLRFRQLVRRLPPKSDLVVDLGPGHTVRLLRYLRNSGRIARGIAVDVSLDRSVAGNGITLLEADLNGLLPLETASADVVTSIAVIEHLHRPELHVAEAHRTLKPGGRLIMTTPSPRSKGILEFLAYRLHVIDEHEIRDHKHYFDERELRQTMAAAGFRPEDVTYHGFLFGLNQLLVVTRS